MNTLTAGQVQYLLWQLVKEGEPEVAMLIAFDQTITNEEDRPNEQLPNRA